MEALNEEQKKFIDKNYIQIPDVDQLTKVLFKNEKLDGRNKEGKLVASYMIERGYGYKTRSHKKAKKITLSEDQKKLIIEYHDDDGLSSLQIAQLIFQDKEVKNLSKEQRVVANFLKTHSKDFVKPEESLSCSVDYAPPSNHKEAIEKINQYTSEEFLLDFSKLKKQDKDCVNNLMKSLNSPRFIQIVNTYGEQDAFLLRLNL